MFRVQDYVTTCGLKDQLYQINSHLNPKFIRRVANVQDRRLSIDSDESV